MEQKENTMGLFCISDIWGDAKKNAISHVNHQILIMKMDRHIKEQEELRFKELVKEAITELNNSKS